MKSFITFFFIVINLQHSMEMWKLSVDNLKSIEKILNRPIKTKISKLEIQKPALKNNLTKPAIWNGKIEFVVNLFKKGFIQIKKNPIKYLILVSVVPFGSKAIRRNFIQRNKLKKKPSNEDMFLLFQSFNNSNPIEIRETKKKDFQWRPVNDGAGRLEEAVDFRGSLPATKDSVDDKVSLPERENRVNGINELPTTKDSVDDTVSLPEAESPVNSINPLRTPKDSVDDTVSLPERENRVNGINELPKREEGVDIQYTAIGPEKLTDEKEKLSLPSEDSRDADSADGTTTIAHDGHQSDSQEIQAEAIELPPVKEQSPDSIKEQSHNSLDIKLAMAPADSNDHQAKDQLLEDSKSDSFEVGIILAETDKSIKETKAIQLSEEIDQLVVQATPTRPMEDPIQNIQNNNTQKNPLPFNSSDPSTSSSTSSGILPNGVSQNNTNSMTGLATSSIIPESIVLSKNPKQQLPSQQPMDDNKSLGISTGPMAPRLPMNPQPANIPTAFQNFISKLQYDPKKIHLELSHHGTEQEIKNLLENIKNHKDQLIYLDTELNPIEILKLHIFEHKNEYRCFLQLFNNGILKRNNGQKARGESCGAISIDMNYKEFSEKKDQIIQKIKDELIDVHGLDELIDVRGLDKSINVHELHLIEMIFIGNFTDNKNQRSKEEEKKYIYNGDLDFGKINEFLKTRWDSFSIENEDFKDKSSGHIVDNLFDVGVDNQDNNPLFKLLTNFKKRFDGIFVSIDTSDHYDSEKLKENNLFYYECDMLETILTEYSNNNNNNPLQLTTAQKKIFGTDLKCKYQLVEDFYNFAVQEYRGDQSVKESKDFLTYESVKDHWDQYKFLFQDKTILLRFILQERVRMQPILLDVLSRIRNLNPVQTIQNENELDEDELLIAKLSYVLSDFTRQWGQELTLNWHQSPWGKKYIKNQRPNDDFFIKIEELLKPLDLPYEIKENIKRLSFHPLKLFKYFEAILEKVKIREEKPIIQIEKDAMLHWFDFFNKKFKNKNNQSQSHFAYNVDQHLNNLANNDKALTTEEIIFFYYLKHRGFNEGLIVFQKKDPEDSILKNVYFDDNHIQNPSMVLVPWLYYNGNDNGEDINIDSLNNGNLAMIFGSGGHWEKLSPLTFK